MKVRHMISFTFVRCEISLSIRIASIHKVVLVYEKYVRRMNVRIGIHEMSSNILSHGGRGPCQYAHPLEDGGRWPCPHALYEIAHLCHA